MWPTNWKICSNEIPAKSAKGPICVNRDFHKRVLVLP